MTSVPLVLPLRRPFDLDLTGIEPAPDDPVGARARVALAVLAELTGGRVRFHRADPWHGGSGRAFEDLMERMRGPDPVTVDETWSRAHLASLSILGAARRGRVEFLGGEPASAVHGFLGNLGIALHRTARGWSVDGTSTLTPARLPPEPTGEVVLAAAVAAAFDATEVEVERVRSVCPWMATALELLPESGRPIALIGMRASGKSTLAAEVATRTGWERVDVDEELVAVHGEIAGIVAAGGWETFRRLEAAAVEDAFKAGRVVALGGGAIETESVREVLRRRAITVYIDEDVSRLRERLRLDPTVRPSLTGRDPADEIDDVLERRRPLYVAAADLHLLGGGRRPSALVEELIDALRAAVRFGPDAGRLRAPAFD